MLFSVNYHSKHKLAADEIRCPYNQVGILYKFMQENPNKRYVISYDSSSIEGLDKLLGQLNLIIKDLVSDYTIACKSLKVMNTLIHQGYKAYLDIPVTDWEMFRALEDYGVSDIYIDGALGFYMDYFNGLREKAYKVRVSPTVSPSGSFAANKSYKSFYIRPEDLRENYFAIDVIDFKINDQDEEDALFSIYKRGTFNYGIGDLIKGLDKEINNVLFYKDFGQVRSKCHQRCMVTQNCNYCYRMVKVMKHINTINKTN